METKEEYKINSSESKFLENFKGTLIAFDLVDGERLLGYVDGFDSENYYVHLLDYGYSVIRKTSVSVIHLGYKSVTCYLDGNELDTLRLIGKGKDLEETVHNMISIGIDSSLRGMPSEKLSERKR